VVNRGELTSRGLVEWLAGLDPATAQVQLAQVVGWAREALADEDAAARRAVAPVPPVAPAPGWGPPPPPQQWGPAPQVPLNTTTGGMVTQVFAGGPPDMTNEQIQGQRGSVPSPYFDPTGTLGEKHGFIQPPGSGLLPGWDQLSASQRIEHFQGLPRWASEMLWSQMSANQRRTFQQQRMHRPWTQLGS
jgi:hypothetical protein